MVRVHVREEDIRVLHADAQLIQAGEQRLPALVLAEAGVYEQVASALAFDEVGVQVFQRVPGQRDEDAVDVLFYMCVHIGSSCNNSIKLF